MCKKAFECTQCSELSIISELVTDLQALQAVETFLGECVSPNGYTVGLHDMFKNKKIILQIV